MKPLAIVHLLTHSEVTRGGAFQALLLAREQHRAGHAVHVIANTDSAEDVHATFLPWACQGLHIENYALSLGAHWVREVPRFRRLLDRLRPDVLHAHRDDALLFALMATALRPRPVIVSQRGTTHPFRTALAGYAHRSRRVDRFIAVAAAVADSLALQGVPREKIDVVYGAFDFERFAPERADRAKVRRELGLPPGRKLAVQIGELNEKKCPTDFIRAAALTVAAGRDVCFALAGKGKLTRRCAALADELRLGDRLRLLGFRTDVEDVLAAADLAVHAAAGHEGLTGALREAAAMGLPIVSTAVAGNPELVEDGATGLLVPPRSPAAISSAVIRLLDDPSLAQRLGRAARERALADMHPRGRADRVEGIYRQLLERRSGQAQQARREAEFPLDRSAEVGGA